MGRKLPWADLSRTNVIKVSQKSNQAIRAEASIKQETKSEPNADMETGAISLLATPHKDGSKNRKRGRAEHSLTRDGRSPSTSPPPAPPDIDFMREGLEGDDVYMLVEDEFQAIARSYTAHLHHAEYKRRMNEAQRRNRNRSGQTQAMPTAPGNATTDTKHKLKRLALEQKQMNGLRKIIGEEDQIGEEDEEGAVSKKDVVEPWAGTSLAGLMNWDASSKTSLRGLEKISGGSRAALGYGPNPDSGQGEQEEGPEITGTVKIDDRDAVERRSRNYLHSEQGSSHLTSKPTPKPIISNFERKKTGTNMSGSTIRNGSEKSKSFSGEKAAILSTQLSSDIGTNPPSSKRSWNKYRSFVASPDDGFDDGFDDTKFAQSQTSKKDAGTFTKPASQEEDRTRIKHENRNIPPDAKKKNRSSRYDEIPVFMA